MAARPERTILVAPAESHPGLEVILAAEGIWADAKPSSEAPVLIATTAPGTPEERSAPAGAVGPVVLVAGTAAGVRSASVALGEPLATVAIDGPVTLEIGGADAEAAHILAEAGLAEVRVPLSEVLATAPAGFDVLATVRAGGVSYPALARRGDTVLLGVDPGASLFSLLTESYAAVAEEAEELPGLLSRIYRLLPFRARLLVYRVAWRRLRAGAERRAAFATRYPIDPAGWAFHRLLVAALGLASGGVPSVWRWPGGASHAVCFTHDIEPRPFAYRVGLPRLLNILRAAGVRSTVSIVAEPGFDLPSESIARAVEDGHEVISHGLHHDGRFNLLDRAERLERVTRSLEIVGSVAGRPATGFRIPWLQRTADFAEVLEDAGVVVDSSMVDSDTSMKKAWHGMGVSYNYPYRLPSRVRPRTLSRVLELPIAGPQDMELVFAGFGVKRCVAALTAKLVWCRRIGAAYVVIVHAGVYGRSDADTREHLLRALLGEVAAHEGAWVATLGEVERWWSARGRVRVWRQGAADGTIEIGVRNEGSETIDDIWVSCGSAGSLVLVSGAEVVTRASGDGLIARVGALAPGQAVFLALTRPIEEPVENR